MTTDATDNVIAFARRPQKAPAPEAEPKPRWTISEFRFDPKLRRLTMTFIDANNKPIGVLGFKVDSIWPDDFDWVGFCEWWTGLKDTFGHAS